MYTTETIRKVVLSFCRLDYEFLTWTFNNLPFPTHPQPWNTAYTWYSVWICPKKQSHLKYLFSCLLG